MKKVGTLMPTSLESLQRENALNKNDCVVYPNKVIDLTEDRFAKMMDWLWAEIVQTWPNAFTNKHHPLSANWREEPEWQKQVKRLTIYQLINGLDAIKKIEKYNDFAPLAHAFANIASELPIDKGFPRKEEIFRNIQMWRSLSPKQRMPAALWIIRYSHRWDVMLTNTFAAKDEFNYCYQALTHHVMAGGSLPSLEEAPLQLAVHEQRITGDMR